jgi:hypothetical protein
MQNIQRINKVRPRHDPSCLLKRYTWQLDIRVLCARGAVRRVRPLLCFGLTSAVSSENPGAER